MTEKKIRVNSPLPSFLKFPARVWEQVFVTERDGSTGRRWSSRLVTKEDEVRRQIISDRLLKVTTSEEFHKQLASIGEYYV